MREILEKRLEFSSLKNNSFAIFWIVKISRKIEGRGIRLKTQSKTKKKFQNLWS